MHYRWNGSDDYIEPMNNPVLSAFDQHVGTTTTKDIFSRQNLHKAIVYAKTEDLHVDAVEKMTDGMT